MEKPKNGQAAKPGQNRIRDYVALALVAVAAILLIVWLTSDDGDSGDSAGGKAEIVSVDSLRDAVGGGATPVYWAGEQSGTQLELSQPEAGRTYVRYLTGGAEAGDPRAEFLTVGTYAHPRAVAMLKRQGARSGGVIGTAPGGATVYFNRKQPHSVYLAYPGVGVEIEVFDPNFTHALRLVNSGQIVPVG
jgi:hypothetical protein